MGNKRQLVVAIALVRNSEGKILLQKRVDPKIIGADGKWEFPGGRVDYDENPLETARRECYEEVGCEVTIKRLLPLVRSKVWQRTDGNEQHVLVFCYETEWLKGTPTLCDPMVSEVGWFSIDEISSLDMLEGIAEFIEIANEGK